MRDVESCEGREPRAIAFERHESGILREKSFDSIGEKMTVRSLGKYFKNPVINGYNVPVAVLIAPEDNVNGVILRHLNTGAYIGVATIGKQKQASNERDDRSLMRVPYQFTLYSDLLIPAGYGLFLNTYQGSSVGFEMSWDVLNADGTIA